MASDSDKLKISELKGDAAKKYTEQCSKAEFPKGICKVGPYGFIASKDCASQFNEFLECEIRLDDVWICGFPRSGTTWLQEIVWLIVNDLDFEMAKVIHSQARIPCLESAKGRHVPKYKTRHIESLEAIKSPRCIKSHIPYHLFPTQMTEKAAKMIHIRRDVRDVCVSYFHFHVSFKGFTGSLDNFVEAFVSDVVACGPYFNTLKSYWNLRNMSNILILTYEEMKENMPNTIEKIAKFLGKTISPEDSKRLENHVNFSTMKTNPRINLDDTKEYFEKKFQKPWTNSFIRKGETGSWERELSQESIDKLNRWIDEKSDGLLQEWN